MKLTKYFLRGLLVLVPLLLTVTIIDVVFSRLSQAIFAPVGARLLQAEQAAKFVSVTGALATVALITVVGLLASNFLGRQVVRLVDRLLDRLPLVKLLYGSIKDLLGAFVGDKKSFDQPVMVALTATTGVIGFVTRHDLSALGLEGHVSVYLPQSYNFAGNLLMVARDAITPLDADSSDVMAFLVSGGVSG